MKKTKDDFNSAHYLWIVPIALAISPIGTIVTSIGMSFDFKETLILIVFQVMAFFVLGIISNFGE